MFLSSMFLSYILSSRLRVFAHNYSNKEGPSHRANIEGGWRESMHRRGKRTAHRKIGDRKIRDRKMDDRKMDDRKMAYNSITS